MNSEERLVAQVALELLRHNDRVEPFGQLALEDAADELKLPAVVVLARFVSEEQGAPEIPKSYTLTVELRGLPKAHPSDAIDEVFRAIGTALSVKDTAYIPPTFTAAFDYYTIETQTGSDYSAGETVTRKREYNVFARLL